MIASYLSYFFKAQNEYALHSPFVFGLYTEVIKSKKEYYAFRKIEMLRFQLLKNHQIIEIQDFGAGSRIFQSNKRMVSKMAQYSLATRQRARLLFKLINHFQPQNVIELGTSLGITTLYLASASSRAKVYTFEGCPETAQIAQQTFHNYTAQNIELIIGKLEDTLTQNLHWIGTVDFVFFDANHQYQPTLDYFETCLQYAHEDSIFIFDDIHWSKEMEKAWEKIKSNEKVSLTIDLFSLGLVFFRKGIEKQDFMLRF